jgi:hypothetical protein
MNVLESVLRNGLLGGLEKDSVRPRNPAAWEVDSALEFRRLLASIVRDLEAF